MMRTAAENRFPTKESDFGRIQSRNNIIKLFAEINERGNVEVWLLAASPLPLLFPEQHHRPVFEPMAAAPPRVG